MPDSADHRDGSVYSCNRDVFHPPRANDDFSCFNGSSCTTTNGAATDQTCLKRTPYPKLHINSLPTELLHLIFSFLSVPALDAACLVSKAWYIGILDGSYLLAQALELPVVTPHRRLLTAFDEATSLTATRRHRDCWRARFRQHRVQFSSARDSDETKPDDNVAIGGNPSPEIRSAVYFPAYDLYFVETYKLKTPLDLQVYSEPEARKFIVYRLLTERTIEFVCQLDVPRVSTPVRIKDIQELDFGTRWRITLEAEAEPTVYDITVRSAYQSGENPYQVATVNPSVPEISVNLGFKKNCSAVLDDFQLLSQIPPEDTVFDPTSSNIVRRYPRYDEETDKLLPFSHEDFAYGKEIMGFMDTFYVVHNPASSQLHLLRYRPPAIRSSEEADAAQVAMGHDTEPSPDLQQQCSVLGSFSPPCEGEHVFKNLAVASNVVRNVRLYPIVRAAILWRDKQNERPSHNLLYLYEIPWYLADKVPSHFGTLKGKRISSLPPDFGGFHPNSPLLHTSVSSTAGELGIDKTTALGGMSFPPRPTARGIWTDQWCKLLLWGPSPSSRSQDEPGRHSESCETLELQTFDFSFMTPERLAACNIPSPNPVDHRPRRTMLSRRIENCCCVLHDEVWNVELPELGPPSPSPPLPPPPPPQAAATAVALLSSPPRPFFQRFWKQKPKPNPVPQPTVETRNEGTIARRFTPAQLAAEARQEEWFRRRIVGMKLLGKEDGEVDTIWKYAAWTKYGVVPKPEGWKQEWRRWGEELGVIPVTDKEEETGKDGRGCRTFDEILGETQ